MIEDHTIFIDTNNLEQIFILDRIYDPIGEVILFTKESIKYTLLITSIHDTFEVTDADHPIQIRIIYVKKNKTIIHNDTIL